MRRGLIIVVVAVVAVIIVLLIGASVLNVNRFRPKIEAELQTKLNRAVTLGQLHLKLVPFSIRVDGLTIRESPAFPSASPFATAKEVYVSASLLSLIRGDPKIKSLTLQDPQIELIRNAAGVWNFSDLGASGTQSAKSKDDNSTSQFVLDKLKLNNGQVAVTDQHAQTPRTVYNHIDLTLAGFAPGKQFGIDVAAHLPGQGKELLAFTGQAGPLAQVNTPLTGHLTIQQVSLAAFNGITNGAFFRNTDAVASGTANIASQSGNTNCTGTLTLTNAVVRGTKLGYPIDAQYDLSLNQKGDQIQVKTASLKIGPTVVSLAGDIDSAAKPANLNLQLSTNNASIPDLLSLISLFGGSPNANDQLKGSLTANLALRGAASAPNIQGDLSASALQTQEVIFNNAHASLNLRLTLDSTSNLAQTLNGVVNLNATNGRLKNVNILNELARVGKFLNSTPAHAGSGSDLQRLTGTFNVQNGVATTTNLAAALTEGSLSATGSLNLVSEGIDMRVTVVLANNVSNQVGGTGIGGFMNAALANNNGELVLPVLVTGTMAHPVFAPDVQAIAKMKMNRLLPTTGDPSKLTNGIIGSVLGGALGQQSNSRNKPQPQNPLNSILNQLGKKKH